MPVIATSGTASCATISISWFKDIGDGCPIEANKKFLDSDEKQQRKAVVSFTDQIKSFYDDILYPTAQPLGQTGHAPFECIMRTIRGDYYDDFVESFDCSDSDFEESCLNGKLISVLLNEYTLQQKGWYWPKQLLKWDFSLVDCTYNDLGQRCFLFIRNKNRVGFKNVGYKTLKSVQKAYEKAANG